MQLEQNLVFGSINTFGIHIKTNPFQLIFLLHHTVFCNHSKQHLYQPPFDDLYRKFEKQVVFWVVVSLYFLYFIQGVCGFISFVNCTEKHWKLPMQSTVSLMGLHASQSLLLSFCSNVQMHVHHPIFDKALFLRAMNIC